MLPKVSIIIPVYNEEKVIEDCLRSLSQQSYKNLEIILVDDGSKDDSKIKIQNSKLEYKDLDVSLLEQDHKGAGAARNLGVKDARGEILVFVDADMTFDKKFIEKLTKPIRAGKTIGTFSKNELVTNKNNLWSKCWNFNKKLPFDRMHPKKYPDKQPVFRAILKKNFQKVGGFDLIGYMDDYTLSYKLGTMATVAPEAFFYHKNPDNLKEIFQQARWVGTSEYKNRKIKNEYIMRIISIIRYSPPFTIINGLLGVIHFRLPRYIVFKLIYDLAIEISLFKSFFKKGTAK